MHAVGSVGWMRIWKIRASCRRRSSREQKEALNQIRDSLTTQKTEPEYKPLLNPDYLETLDNPQKTTVVVNPPKTELRMVAAAARQEREAGLHHIRVQNRTGLMKNQSGGYTLYGDFPEAQAPDPYSGLQGAFVGKTLSYGTIVAVTPTRISVALN